MKIRKVICDRCGEKIRGKPVHILVSGGSIAKEDGNSLFNNDFCMECISDIIDFALNKGTCDECIWEMEETAALLRADDEETEISSNMEKYRDVRTTYLGEPVKRDLCTADENGESGSRKEPDPDQLVCGIDLGAGNDMTCLASAEEVREIMKTIRQEHRCRSGQHQ
ncbi:MAG: hypothetical protein NC489_32645 [Ruminococcus flavefaciens]|nr:hypothetical protein [Ruminococcus flavefaciens]